MVREKAREVRENENCESVATLFFEKVLSNCSRHYGNHRYKPILSFKLGKWKDKEWGNKKIDYLRKTKSVVMKREKVDSFDLFVNAQLFFEKFCLWCYEKRL